MYNIYDLTLKDFEVLLEENKIPKFKAKQIWNWLYVNLVSEHDMMLNLDKKTINLLKENTYFPELENLLSLKDGDETQKILLKVADDECIETVLMKQKYGYSVCVTSQIGCAVGCSFCASGLLGLKRDLTAGEIVMQVIFWQKYLKKINSRVSHIVIMGIGEPLNNYDNVIKFIDTINDEKGLNIGARHITLSTSGIVPGINRLKDYPKQINLAISLHASNDDIRNDMMKINKAYPISLLLDSVKEYQLKTNRRVSFEYIMLKGVNDSDDDAKELSTLLKDINCHINLIPYNEVEEFEFVKSDRIEKFEKILSNNNMNVTVRKSRGKKIDGACGQLRYKKDKR